jgi:hypothetical protein
MTEIKLTRKSTPQSFFIHQLLKLTPQTEIQKREIKPVDLIFVAIYS